MKTHLSKRNHAMTLIELFVVVAVLMVLAALILPALGRQRAQVLRINCVNNLKQVGLAFRVWAGDNTNRFPMTVPGTNGGSMEYVTGPNAFRHFQVMSNELSTPLMITCPSESPDFRRATNFTDINNSNISFFVGVDANETNVQMILSGDRNITNGKSVKNGLLELTPGRLTGWTSEMHNKVGNILLADGSVQQVSIGGLRSTMANTGFATNRLQMP